MKIYVCIDVDASDIALLLMLARQENTPVDALIKTAIAQYVASKIAPRQTAATTAGGEK